MGRGRVGKEETESAGPAEEIVMGEAGKKELYESALVREGRE